MSVRSSLCAERGSLEEVCDGLEQAREEGQTEQFVEEFLLNSISCPQQPIYAVSDMISGHLHKSLDRLKPYNEFSFFIEVSSVMLWSPLVLKVQENLIGYPLIILLRSNARAQR